MASRDFLEEQRRRQRELVAIKKARQNPELIPEPVAAEPEPLTVGGKLKNFWFYYKYFLLAGVFLAVVLAVAISQCANREKFDSEVILFTYHSYTTGQIDAIEEELEKYGEDINGDGEVNIQIIDCAFSQSDLVDTQNAKRTKLTANIASNSSAMLFITDSESYIYLETLFEDGFFVDLGLPEDDGKTLLLDEEFYNNVNSKSENGFSLPDGLKIGRRIASEDTIVGKDKDAKTQSDAADKMLSLMTEK